MIKYRDKKKCGFGGTISPSPQWLIEVQISKEQLLG